MKRATTPATKNAMNVPPLPTPTARPSTAKIPPPTIPPTPIETASRYPMPSIEAVFVSVPSGCTRVSLPESYRKPEAMARSSWVFGVAATRGGDDVYLSLASASSDTSGATRQLFAWKRRGWHVLERVGR